MKMKLLYLSALMLIAFVTNQISAARYVALGNSRYRPYENMFNKKPKLNFRKQYYNRYISDAVNQIDNRRPKIRVCFNNVITIEDPVLNGYDAIYKDSRIIAEYDFSKISKYTSLKFYLTTRNCHINLDFDRQLDQGTLGWTTFAVYNGKPHANVFMDRGQIKNLANSMGISYLKAYMQVLMHEILHGLGLGHSEDDHNSKSIIRAVYDGSTQQLLYKKDVYNLRSIYGARRRQTAFPNGTRVEFDYSEPREWDDLVLRNMEDNSPEITLNINKDVSSTTNNPVKTTTIITSTTSKRPMKTTTNKPFIPTGAVEPIDPPPIETTTSSQITQSTTTKPRKTTTNIPVKSTADIPPKTTTHTIEKSTMNAPMKRTEESNEITSGNPTKTTTKRPKATTPHRPSKTTTRKPAKSTTIVPDKTTTKKPTTRISLVNLQKELSKIKYSNRE